MNSSATLQNMVDPEASGDCAKEENILLNCEFSIY